MDVVQYIRDLRAAGFSEEDALRAADMAQQQVHTALSDAEERRLAGKRDANRARQQAKRARDRSTSPPDGEVPVTPVTPVTRDERDVTPVTRDSRHVTRDERDTALAQPLTSDSLNEASSAPLPAKENPPSGGKRKAPSPLPTDPPPPRTDVATISPANVVIPFGARAQRKATFLPDNWRPTPTTWSDIAQACFEDDMEGELLAFRDHFASTTKNPQKRDWDATYRNWMRKFLKDGGRRKGHGRSGGRVTAQSLREAALAVVAEEEAAGR